MKAISAPNGISKRTRRRASRAAAAIATMAASSSGQARIDLIQYIGATVGERLRRRDGATIGFGLAAVFVEGLFVGLAVPDEDIAPLLSSVPSPHALLPLAVAATDDLEPGQSLTIFTADREPNAALRHDACDEVANPARPMRPRRS